MMIETVHIARIVKGTYIFFTERTYYSECDHFQSNFRLLRFPNVVLVFLNN